MESMAERAKHRAEKRKTFGGRHLVLPDGVELIKLVKGPNYLDILPYVIKADNHPEAKKGETWYERMYYTHGGIGPEETTVVCPTTFGKKCPVCEEHMRLRKDENADEEVVNALRKKERELFNVFDPKNENAGIQVLDISTFLFSNLLEEHIRTGDIQKASFAELVGGSTLKVTMSDTKGNRGSFLKATIIDFNPREDYGDDVLEQTYDLDAMLVVLPYADLQKLFLGLDDDAPAPAPVEAPTRIPSRRPGPTRTEAPPVEKEEAPPPPSRPTPRRPGAANPPPDAPPSQRPGRARVPVTPPPEPEPENEVAEGECPHGHTYGKDCDTKDECAECKVWEPCKDEQDKLAASASRKPEAKKGFSRRT